nr:hypothetical protein CFP56_65547 [Quercus suber]
MQQYANGSLGRKSDERQFCVRALAGADVAFATSNRRIGYVQISKHRYLRTRSGHILKRVGRLLQHISSLIVLRRRKYMQESASCTGRYTCSESLACHCRSLSKSSSRSEALPIPSLSVHATSSLMRCPSIDDPENCAYPVFPPPVPQQILEHIASYTALIRQRKFGGPIGEFKDTPLFALYRMYELMVIDDYLGLRNELEVFWWKPWPVHEIPEPKDGDEPDRYAVLSCIPALLVEAFNARIDLGLRRDGHAIMTIEERDELARTPKAYEQVPTWTLHVAPLATTLAITHRMPTVKQIDSLHDEKASPIFREKNVLYWHPHIHFV